MATRQSKPQAAKAEPVTVLTMTLTGVPGKTSIEVDKVQLASDIYSDEQLLAFYPALTYVLHHAVLEGRPVTGIAMPISGGE